MKLRFVVVLICLISLNTSAQTLFTYGTHAVNKDEFLQAYNKNPDTTANRQKKINDYLNLYVNFRLKLQDAYDKRVNTNADIKAEADNFKTQLADNYINQQADIKQLLHEAFVRSQEDVLLQQVFVPFSGIDTSDAYSKINTAYSELKKGKSFDAVAQEYAFDSASKATKGMVGYITVFTLPYTMENIVYNLQPGNFSFVYKSKIGYHIFKNAGERKAFGRRKIEQLLFANPAFFTANQTKDVQKQADSIYSLLQSGTSFESLLPLYGKNYQSSDLSLNAIEVKIGEYNSDFENEVFNLKKTGDISKPFQTAYGYNIIKLVDVMPVSSDENDVTNTAYLQQQIQTDGRLDAAKANLIEKWMPLTRFKESAYNKTDLWSYTDSAIFNRDKQPGSYKNIKLTTVLFEFEKKKFTVNDWIVYMQPVQSVLQPVDSHAQYEKYMHDFINVSCNNYYRQNIEDFDPQLKDQLKEFSDANMLFYVMDKNVWGKAAQDSAGLKNYYTQHANNYKWNNSIIALVISGADKQVVTAAAEKIKNNPLNWRTITASYGTAIYVDSNRFEADQLPVKQTIQLQKNFQSSVEPNEAGDSYTFMHVIDVYPQPATRSFDDAKGLVINDYQDALEKQWIDDLKKTYPVKVNEGVLKTVYNKE